MYDILFPLAFILFLPGMLFKLARRGGEKRGYLERFAIFADEKRKALEAFRGAVWVHSVSVGETVIALAFVEKWLEFDPEARFVISTTTTTGQALARSRKPANTEVVFCPLDFRPFVRRTLGLLRPSMLVVFETEIWPNLFRETRAFGAPVALVNARISDNSAPGYKRFAFFFAPVLERLSLLCVQTELDAERFKAVSAKLEPVVTGNMKFDQKPPAEIAEVDLTPFFGSGSVKTILAASTHPGEEALIAEVFKRLKSERPALRLIIVPRHAERGAEIAAQLEKAGLSFVRRSQALKTDAAVFRGDPVDVLLADTTGEMLSFIAAADVVVMGKSLAGHTEGHNILEPAILAKPVVTGNKLSNFRFILKAMLEADAVWTVADSVELRAVLAELVDDGDLAAELGRRAKSAVEKYAGATKRNVELCRKLLR